jgi:hypothetical protein
MVKGKARYPGKGFGELSKWKLSGPTREKIRSLRPARREDEELKVNLKKRAEIMSEIWPEESGPLHTHPEDFFVDDIEHEAKWAEHQLLELSRGFDRKDTLATLKNLSRRTKTLRDDLRMLSVGVDRLFPIDRDPKSHADYLETVYQDIESAVGLADKSGKKVRRDTARRKIAEEYAIRVLRVCKKHELQASATFHKEDSLEYYVSDAIKLLIYTGEDIGFNFGGEAWKKILLDVKPLIDDQSGTDNK